MIVVTGGAGFVGANLCEMLLALGREVVCVDDLSTGRKSNIEFAEKFDRFQFREADVQTADLTFSDDVDGIFHLASPASPEAFQAAPIRCLMTNVQGTKNALECAKRNDARFVLASTSEIYGDPEVHPQKEEYNGDVSTTGPRACYDEGKRAAEALCYDYRREHGVDVAVARIFNTYGPKMDPADSRVITTFFRQIEAGRPLTIYGDGTQTRSFCFVTDLTSALWALFQSGVQKPVNLGNPEEVSINELAEIVSVIAGQDCDIVYDPLPEDDPSRRRPDISRAKELLGWEPDVELERGLREYFDYWEQR